VIRVFRGLSHHRIKQSRHGYVIALVEARLGQSVEPVQALFAERLFEGCPHLAILVLVVIELQGAGPAGSSLDESACIPCIF